jgi:hypothetical protein
MFGRPIVPALCAAFMLGLGIYLLGSRPPRVPAPRKPLAPTQILGIINGFLILLCLGAVGVGAAADWGPRTVAAFAGMAAAEIVVGLGIAPFALRADGPRSASLLSFGMLLVGAAWAGAIYGLGGV